MKVFKTLLLVWTVVSLQLMAARPVKAQIITVDTELGCSGGNGVNTAIGCIPINDANALMGFFLKWAIGIGGGIAFILILVAGFQIITSQGDPKSLQAGKELLTSAITGLVLIIFSIFILQVIGVNILGITGFGTQ